MDLGCELFGGSQTCKGVNGDLLVGVWRAMRQHGNFLLIISSHSMHLDLTFHCCMPSHLFWFATSFWCRLELDATSFWCGYGFGEDYI
jgi:hypothetical protein